MTRLFNHFSNYKKKHSTGINIISLVSTGVIKNIVRKVKIKYHFSRTGFRGEAKERPLQAPLIILKRSVQKKHEGTIAVVATSSQLEQKSCKLLLLIMAMSRLQSLRSLSNKTFFAFFEHLFSFFNFFGE